MVESTEKDFAEALRYKGLSEDCIAYFAKCQGVNPNNNYAPDTIAHAQTIAKLRVAMEALEELKVGYGGPNAEVRMSDRAEQALAQIKGPTHD